MTPPPKKPRAQVNIRLDEGVPARWTELATARGMSLAAWLREAAEHWAATCSEATERALSPHELVALQTADHRTVDALVAELMIDALAGKITEVGSALFLRLDPATWRATTGQPGRQPPAETPDKGD